MNHALKTYMPPLRVCVCSGGSPCIAASRSKGPPPLAAKKKPPPPAAAKPKPAAAAKPGPPAAAKPAVAAPSWKKKPAPAVVLKSPPPPPTARQNDYAKAIYDYVPAESDQLGLSEGDIVVVSAQGDDGWWTGSRKEAPSVVGIFPGSYVELVDEATANGNTKRPIYKTNGGLETANVVKEGVAQQLQGVRASIEQERAEIAKLTTELASIKKKKSASASEERDVQNLKDILSKVQALVKSVPDDGRF